MSEKTNDPKILCPKCFGEKIEVPSPRVFRCPACKLRFSLAESYRRQLMAAEKEIAWLKVKLKVTK